MKMNVYKLIAALAVAVALAAPAQADTIFWSVNKVAYDNGEVFSPDDPDDPDGDGVWSHDMGIMNDYEDNIRTAVPDPEAFEFVHVFLVENNYGDAWRYHADDIIGMFGTDPLAWMGAEYFDSVTYAMNDPFSEFYTARGIEGESHLDLYYAPFGLVVLFYEYINPPTKDVLYLWVIGYPGFIGDDHLSEGWPMHAYILNDGEKGLWPAVPEPATGLLALAGVVLLIRRKRR